MNTSPQLSELPDWNNMSDIYVDWKKQSKRPKFKWFYSDELKNNHCSLNCCKIENSIFNHTSWKLNILNACTDTKSIKY